MRKIYKKPIIDIYVVNYNSIMLEDSLGNQIGNTDEENEGGYSKGGSSMWEWMEE